MNIWYLAGFLWCLFIVIGILFFKGASIDDYDAGMPDIEDIK